MSYETIKSEVADKVATITLNRPNNMNSFNPLMCDELLDAFNKADENDNVRVVIVTGAGKAFCAGSDLSGDPFDYSKTNIFAHRDTGGQVSLRIYDMKKPVIGAINGAAVGVGITMTLPMDIRVISEKAKIGFVFASRGIINEGCSGWFLPRLVGAGKAVEWVATGRIISGAEVLDSGLATYMVPPEEVYAKALVIAHEIVNNTAPVSVAMARQLMWKMLGESHPMASHKLESMTLQWIGTSPDALEGVKSFLEKRPPNYSMKPSKEMPPYYPWWDAKGFPKML
ncbi:MAG: crotonase/enoyl-CoA hydratase family protein [Acidaminococcales bacterium]|jgi:enoyl-CoA hydratase/carnithine racemase|nr:crotonase/enoyl-CoA hydratase family protein [Acidaminococcales bacterium]